MRINTLIVALFALIGLGGAVEKANAQIVLSVGIAPPALPVYVQPPIPAPGYIWTPGYWAWNEGYFGVLLGAGSMGDCAASGFVMDSWLLGLERRFICLERRLLGTDRRFLRRRLLRIWLYRGGLRGRLLVRRIFLL